MRKTSSATLTSRVDAPPLQGPVLASGLLGPAAPARREARQQVLGLGDAVPAEVVDHPARDPHQQVLVGLAQEVDDDPPVPARRCRQALDRPLPALDPVQQLAVQEELPEALGDRVDELPLLLQERPLVRGRHRP